MQIIRGDSLRTETRVTEGRETPEVREPDKVESREWRTPDNLPAPLFALTPHDAPVNAKRPHGTAATTAGTVGISLGDVTSIEDVAKAPAGSPATLGGPSDGYPSKSLGAKPTSQ